MKTTDPNYPLSKHFKLWEFTTSQTAERKGIHNQPNNEIVVKLKRLCEHVLEPARQELGPIRVSSGYRSPTLNRAVGGSRTSDHMFGQAADLIPLACSKRKLALWIAKNCQFKQLILEFGSLAEPAWIHVAYEHGNNPEQILRILHGQGYQAITL